MVVIIIKDFTEDRGPSNGVIGKMIEEKMGRELRQRAEYQQDQEAGISMV